MFPNPSQNQNNPPGVGGRANVPANALRAAWEALLRQTLRSAMNPVTPGVNPINMLTPRYYRAVYSGQPGGQLSPASTVQLTGSMGGQQQQQGAVVQYPAYVPQMTPGYAYEPDQMAAAMRAALAVGGGGGQGGGGGAAGGGGGGLQKLTPWEKALFNALVVSGKQLGPQEAPFRELQGGWYTQEGQYLGGNQAEMQANMAKYGWTSAAPTAQFIGPQKRMQRHRNYPGGVTGRSQQVPTNRKKNQGSMFSSSVSGGGAQQQTGAAPAAGWSAELVNWNV